MRHKVNVGLGVRGWLVIAAASVTACSAGGGNVLGGQGGDAGAAGTGSGASSSGTGGGGYNLDSGTGGGDTENCAAQTYGATRAPASVLLVLDRSLSMADCPGETQCTESKWEGARKAITGALNAAPPELGVGLVLFPAGTYTGYDACRNCIVQSMLNNAVPAGCDVHLQDCGCLDISSTPDVPVAELSNSLSAIDTTLASNQPDYNTPTYHALAAAYQSLQSLATNGNRYVLLMTDGDPSVFEPAHQEFVPPMNWYTHPAWLQQCMDLGAILQQTADATQGSPSVKTFVVGSPGVTNTHFMSDLAVAGGTAKSAGCESSQTCYYQIGQTNFAADLQAVLTEIAGQVATCTFALPLDSGEVDPNKVNVSYQIGDDPAEPLFLDAGHEDGWDYTDDSKQAVEIHGPACEAIKASTDSSVTIELGCTTRVK